MFLLYRVGQIEATDDFQPPTADRLFRPRGQSLVEFAVLAPILLFLVLGIWDFGRIYYYQIGLTDAVYQGARVAARSDRSTTDIRTAVKLAAPGLALADSTILITRPLVSGLPVTVSATYTFAPFTPLVGSWLPGGVLALRSQASEVFR